MNRAASTLCLATLLAISSGAARADTEVVAPSIYKVTTGVEFSLSADGVSDFLFSWSDAGGTFVSVADPTLILRSGQTYTFRNTTSIHPFIITDDSLPVTGADGSYSRTTTNVATLDAATLSPIADFTADVAPTTDAIVWTPQSADAGQYYYTCHVNFHAAMTGAIEVQDATVEGTSSTWAAIKSLFAN